MSRQLPNIHALLLPSLSIGDHSWILDLDGWRSCEVRNLTSSSYQETSRRFYDVPAMNILNFAYSKRHINYTAAMKGLHNYVYIIRNDIHSSSCSRFLFSTIPFVSIYSKCVTMTSTSNSASPAAAAGDTQKKQGGYGKIKTHKESKLSQLSRLDEVFAALTLLYVKVIFYIFGYNMIPMTQI